jgi:hypothetical protein
MIFFHKWQLGPSMARSNTFHAFKKNFKTPETSGAHKSAHQPQPTEVTNCTVFDLHIFFQKKCTKVIYKIQA